MEVILNINDIKYKDIFKDLSIYVEKNKIINISGQNNCGKTTLLRILNREIVNDFNIVLRDKSIYDYTLEEYSQRVQVVFPTEILYREETVEDVLYAKDTAKEKRDFIIKTLKLEKILKLELSTLPLKSLILVQIAKAIINASEIIMLDSLDSYFSKEELSSIYFLFKKCIEKYDLTFILTSIGLEETLFVDELFIINEGKIILHGEPLTVLEKDNILNKAGLDIPFIIDLSVKLRDYDLIDKIILDRNRLINTLWK